MRISFSIAGVFILSVILACSGADRETDAAIDERAPASAQTAAVESAASDASPEDVARSSMEATQAGDQEGFEALLTQKARDGLNAGDGENSRFKMHDDKLDEYTVGEATIEGEEATVPVDAVEDGKPQNMKFKMRREDEQWRIYGVAMSLGENDGAPVEFTLDFEKMGQMMESMVQGMVEGLGDGLQESFQSSIQQSMSGTSDEQLTEDRTRYEALRSVAEDEVREGWVNAVSFEGVTFADALADLAEGLGLSLHVGDHEEALSQSVSVSLAGISRLEAIEAISASAGLYPIYPEPELQMGVFGEAMVQALASGMEAMFTSTDSAISFDGLGDAEPAQDEAIEEPEKETIPANAIQLSAGPRPYPVAFMGPFMIEIEEIEESVPHAKGEIAFEVRAIGLNESVLAMLSQLSESTRFDRIEDAQGRSLIKPDVHYMSSGKIEGATYTDGFRIDLLNLIREVEEIHMFQGVQDLPLPINVEEVEFSDLTVGASQQVGDFQIVLKKTGTYSQFEISWPEESAEEIKVLCLPFNAAGEQIGIVYQSADSWFPGKAQASVNSSEAPASIKMKIVTESKNLEFPFEIQSIPLKRYAEMPEKIQDLDFGPHPEPLSLELVSIVERDPSFSKIEIRLMNHSNKDATSVFADFVYLDSTGAKLEDFPHTIAGAFSFEGEPILVEKGQTAEQETTAFQMHEKTQSIEFKLHHVEFVDGTRWEPQD